LQVAVVEEPQVVAMAALVELVGIARLLLEKIQVAVQQQNQS
jgi:hypothetical protein